MSTGYKAIASSAASGVSAGHTGYGPGWIALTIDTLGQPHGPITGYLFRDGAAGASGNDHFDVSSYYTAPAASVNTPFAGGYAYGHVTGCTWSYLDTNGRELLAQGPNQTGGCTPPNHTTKIFCYNQAADPLCNAGNSSVEFEAGVWKNITENPALISAGGCDVVGNVGSAAIYSGAAAGPTTAVRAAVRLLPTGLPDCGLTRHVPLCSGCPNRDRVSRARLREQRHRAASRAPLGWRAGTAEPGSRR